MASQMHKRFVWAGLFLIIILLIGTFGFWLIGSGESSLLDALFMTVITITTIGYGEVVDVSSPGGRIFTILIAASGIGVLFYMITNLTALAVEGELTKSFWRGRMERKASNLKGHYIVCGIGEVGWHIATELCTTKRAHVIVDVNGHNIDKALQAFPNSVFLEGDATDESTLLRAGIDKAKGLFAVTGDDNLNLVVTLTAKELNPSVRVVARCSAVANTGKMKKAGTDAIVSPDLIGGLRMASEMIRPTVVSFLDTMLRDREKNLRVEEISVPDHFVGKAISALALKRYRNSLLLAVKTSGHWRYNPGDDYIIEPESALVLMTTPEERDKLETIFGGASS